MFEQSVCAPPASVVDAIVCPDDTAAYLAGAVPGADGAAPLSALDVRRLSHGGRVDALRAIERQLSWLHATQQRVLAAMATRPADAADEADRTGAQWVREDVSRALRMSGVTAEHRLAVARTLAERLPAALTLLEQGAIPYLHAMALADAVQSLDAEASSAIEERALRHAGEQTLSQFKATIRRAVASVAAGAVEQARAQAMNERRVCVTARDDGMAELWALLPAEGAAVVLAAVDALASVTSSADPRTADQRRADSLVDLGVAALHDPRLPKAQGLRPAIHVTVALSTLLGCDDDPAELSGHGPIPAAVARRLAADPSGTWRRLVTDPVGGALLDYGRTTYRPPRDLAEFVIARDRTCVFPTCNRAAHRCDLDHREPYEAGGATSTENLSAVCRRHHRAKHEAGWRLARARDGGHTWTAPTGHRYRSRLPDLSGAGASARAPDVAPPF